MPPLYSMKFQKTPSRRLSLRLFLLQNMLILPLVWGAVLALIGSLPLFSAHGRIPTTPGSIQQ